VEVCADKGNTQIAVKSRNTAVVSIFTTMIDAPVLLRGSAWI
jgi:hypothetical protein